MDVACECLNVKIHLKTGPFPAGHQWTGVFYEGRTGIAEELFQGTLDAGGIVVEQPVLIRQVEVQSSTPVASSGDHGHDHDQQGATVLVATKWKQTQCLNCGLWACSNLLSVGPAQPGAPMPSIVPNSTVLLSSRILTRDRWQSVMSSADYSPALRFVVNMNANVQSAGVGGGTTSSDLLMSGLISGVDSQVDRYAHQEEVNAEERIRQFVEAEKRQLEIIKAKARADRNKLLSDWSARVGSDLDLTSDAPMDSSFAASPTRQPALLSSPPFGGVDPHHAASSAGAHHQIGVGGGPGPFASIAADLTPPDTPHDMSGHDDGSLDVDGPAAGDGGGIGGVAASASAVSRARGAESEPIEMAEDGGHHESAADTLGPLPSPKDFIERGDLGSRVKNRRRVASSIPRLGSSLDAEGLFSLDGLDEGDVIEGSSAKFGPSRHSPSSFNSKRVHLHRSSSSGSTTGGGDQPSRSGLGGLELDSDDDPSPSDGGDDDDVDDAFHRDSFSGMVAHSLPVGVPLPSRRSASIDIAAWPSSSRPAMMNAGHPSAALADMDTDSESPNCAMAPENIAESIKALARSVTMSAADPDEQFLMDLPRPRLRSFKDL